MNFIWKNRLNQFAPLLVSLLIVIILLVLPTGFEDALIYQGCDRTKAEVITADNNSIISNGLIQYGEQYCSVLIKGGKFKGQEAKAYNLLNGSLEQDKIFKVGDQALVVISYEGNQILSVNMVDHYRMNYELILAGAFCVLLIGYAGFSGLRAILSFLITILSLWKILVPAYLNGMNPIWVGMGIMIFLTFMIIYLVYGNDIRTVVATSGSLLGTLTACVLGILFTDLFQIHGAVMSFSETLLYAGYEHLNLTQIFMASIFIGASGAMMDLSVDITSAIHEVVQKKPEIGWKEATISGLHVGRAAMGTMTTTLLLAYSGGYLALLMVFMAQGTPVTNILNLKYVASEMVHTIVGSFGLVTVAPFTAIMSGLLLTHKIQKENQ